MEPNNILLGDVSNSTDLPVAEPLEDDLKEVRQMAAHTNTAEYQRLQEWATSKIEYYQRFLPGGLEVDIDKTPTVEDWRVANRVINDLKEFMGAYDQAKAVADDAAKEEKNGE